MRSCRVTVLTSAQPTSSSPGCPEDSRKCRGTTPTIFVASAPCRWDPEYLPRGVVLGRRARGGIAPRYHFRWRGSERAAREPRVERAMGRRRSGSRRWIEGGGRDGQLATAFGGFSSLHTVYGEIDGISQDPSNLSLEDLLATATGGHAAHLTRVNTASLLVAPRIVLYPLNPPKLVESDFESTRPLALRIPLPSVQHDAHLVVAVSSLTGLIEIDDEGATTERRTRATLASTAVNEQNKSRLLEEVGKLITSVGICRSSRRSEEC